MSLPLIAEIVCFSALIFFTATGDHQRANTILLLLILAELVRGNEARARADKTRYVPDRKDAEV